MLLLVAPGAYVSLVSGEDARVDLNTHHVRISITPQQYLIRAMEADELPKKRVRSAWAKKQLLLHIERRKVSAISRTLANCPGQSHNLETFLNLDVAQSCWNQQTSSSFGRDFLLFEIAEAWEPSAELTECCSFGSGPAWLRRLRRTCKHRHGCFCLHKDRP